MDVKCLDTYALAEIYEGNQKFIKYLESPFVIADLTLAEFYSVLLRDKDENAADLWYNKLVTYTQPVLMRLLIEAVKFRYKHRKLGISFFDAAGYVFALRNGFKFVTGDKEFEKLENVEFVKR